MNARRRLAAAALGLTLAAGPAGRAAAQSTTLNAPRLVVIAGVGGDDEHAVQFEQWSAALVDSAKASGLPSANIVYLGDRPDQDKTRMQARSTRENVVKAFTDLASHVQPGDDVLVILIGHGSADGSQAAFNVTGPDLTPADFDLLLGKLSAERVVFVDTASSSGAFLEPLKKPGRIIVTATKTGGERNEPVFARYFVDALTGKADGADADRNGRISILEAFDYAQTQVKAFYDQGGHILTEHAVLEDGNQGKLAATIFLAPDKARAAQVAAADPAMRALLEQQATLERDVAALRLKKDAMDPAQYDAELEKLVTALALKSREIRDQQPKPAEGPKP